MKNWLKKSLLAISSTIVGCGIIVLPFLIFSQPSNEFVFGNFQSYMSEDVQKELTLQHKINWQYYGSNDEIPTYIQNKTLDLAIATNNLIGQLAVSGDIQPIPWADFGLVKSNGEKITSYTDLQGFVTESTWWLCQAIGSKLELPNINGVACDNLLGYCVPYFMQNFVFAYRGQEIQEFNSSNNSFKEIFDYIANPNNDDTRFISSNSSVMMIDDSRSVYDVARYISGQNSINPSIGILTSSNDLNSSKARTINEFSNEYDYLANYYSTSKLKNTMTFNSDSSIVLNKVALGQSTGAFMYNGDAIYAATGGDNDENTPGLPDFENNNSNLGYHVVIPEQNFYAMDGIVINSRMSDSKKEEAISIIKDLCLDGLGQNADGSAIYDKVGIEDDSTFKYLAMENFNYVQYTPCYTNLYDYAIDSSDQGYFAKDGEITNTTQRDLLIKLMTINPSQVNENKIELPLNELSKSNMDLAYIGFKNKI